MYSYSMLDPRPIPAATEANNKIFATGQVVGIEVTIPTLATRCVINIDPQHSEGNHELTAIEVALTTAELPAEDSILATVRADLDSIGSMSVFQIRKDHEFFSMTAPYGGGEFGQYGHWIGGLNFEKSVAKDFFQRIKKIAVADKFARGGWSGPKPLPTRDNPWAEESASAESTWELAAIAAAVADFKVPLTDRVAMMTKWLLTGEEPKQYRDSVEKERLDMISALEIGAIKHETRFNGRIAVVESTHRAATTVGYSLAPVVVALNPGFRFGGGEPHRKFTICQFTPGYVNLKSAFAELNELEAGWGGSPTIGGSPQGVSSQLTIDQVVEVIEKHLM